MSNVQQTSTAVYHETVLPTISAREEQVMWTLRSKGNLTNREIAAYLDLAPSDTSGRVNKLNKKGLIRRCKKRVCAKSFKVVWEWELRRDDNLQLNIL